MLSAIIRARGSWCRRASTAAAALTRGTVTLLGCALRLRCMQWRCQGRGLILGICGRIIHMDSLISSELSKRIAEHDEFRVSTGKTSIFGTCKDCI